MEAIFETIGLVVKTILFFFVVLASFYGGWFAREKKYQKDKGWLE